MNPSTPRNRSNNRNRSLSPSRTRTRNNNRSRSPTRTRTRTDHNDEEGNNKSSSSSAVITTTTISKDSIIARLGGESVIRGAIYRFYKRVIADPELAPFFKNVSMNRLRNHQYRFMALALGGGSGTVDSEALTRTMIRSHKRLFVMGLNETHFDRVFDHFVHVLQEKNANPEALKDFGVALSGFRPHFVEKERLAAFPSEQQQQQGGLNNKSSATYCHQPQQKNKVSSQQQPPVSINSAAAWRF